MADKHILTLEILREYGTDLCIPREVEFNIVALIPIEEPVVLKRDSLWMGRRS
jgi:hypothetical protein